MSVVPYAQIATGDAALRDDSRCLKNDEASATLSAAAEMNEVPVGGKTVLRGVLAHGRDTNAVRESNGAKRKRQKERLGHECLIHGENNSETAKRDH
jgi:hypothetical protein